MLDVNSPSRPLTLLDKDEVTAGLVDVWRTIDALMADVPEDGWQTATALPGWCVRDVVAHVVGTECMLAGLPTPDVDVSGLGHVRNPIGELNECWVRHLSADAGADVLTRFRDVTAQRRAALEAMSREEWDAPTATPAGQDTYGRFMRIRIFDCWMHEHDVRDALSLPASAAELDGAASRFALDEVAVSMGFVVGKRAQAPDGSRVALVLTGPLARTIRVAVDGRAAVVDDFGGAEPTATITLDGFAFTRLCGGRLRGPADVVYGGDVELGERVVANLNYVI